MRLRFCVGQLILNQVGCSRDCCSSRLATWRLFETRKGVITMEHAVVYFAVGVIYLGAGVWVMLTH